MNDSNNENTTKEIEIINIGKEGMSYGKLKRLHSMFMLTLNNMSKVILSLPSTSTSTSSSPTNPIILYSSKNVKISITNNNWLILYYPFKEGCWMCHYYEHSLKNCPNLKPEFQEVDCCIHCWESEHLSGNCSRDSKVPPYNEDFLLLEEIINNLFYK
ncbi:unnamed protein product [Rhizophagus irregularis]|uniref:Uncharacterized protein n=1 Tax=Rhizophagus irregularis TaxID=588596 RepID=A0A2I1HQB0_9GLOM|nr:hypothetical protein RhiirA4_485367 [Rhizophagus irregularis]CAB4422733.1 unnamed protein product [Rhizophagus irregularis]